VSDDASLEHLVQRWTNGDREALDGLVELLYDDLRAMAHRQLRAERTAHTLTTTALVHEAYVELARRTGPSWQGRPQLLALLAKVMRHVLVDYARIRKAAKRGGGEFHLALDDQTMGADDGLLEVLAVDRALERLERRDPRLARIVECRFFAGMPEAEIADALGVSTRTIERDWTRARTYLHSLLGAEPDTPDTE
jgi:RNA polymerase sigma factor (TIGR02999 family)